MINKVITAINTFGKKNKCEKICVSLSGGVDSMVLLHCLKMYQIRTKDFVSGTKFSLSAVHINYNNRESCIDEVNFVQTFCNSLKVPLFIRHITEMTRERDNTRQEYETLTRNIRFDAYKTQSCPILLGHNYEDTIENLISNIASKKKYYNLKGMKYEIIENGVTVIRPLLHISKSEIYMYAKNFDIKYLSDSTPKWSRRGKLRDHIIPTLERYEPNLIKGLEAIAQMLSDKYNTNG